MPNDCLVVDWYFLVYAIEGLAPIVNQDQRGIKL